MSKLSFRSHIPILLSTLCICSAFAQAAPAPAAAPVQPYTLPATEVQTLHAANLKRDYEIYVSLPASYGQSQKTYPVVFITDANYAFAVVRNISQFITRHDGNLQEFILVGLGYAKGDAPVDSRNRDYTPVAKAGSAPGDGKYGEVEAYRQFVAAEVFPFVAHNYRADMSKKVFIGHSYGALFGIHALLSEPAMFNAYILGSPSLWYGKHTMLDTERAYAASKKDLPARVFMASGSFESVRPQAKSPRYNQTNDLVKDMQAFEKQLKSRHYPGLSVHSEVVEGEDHVTVFPAIATHGLMWALPAK